MKGTLALWYEPSSPSTSETDQRVGVELHVNLWRDLPSGGNFLDIGLLFVNPAAMSRFYLYVPAPLIREQISDLSGILRSTANAVFNDVVSFGAEADGRYEIVRSGTTDTVFEIAHDDIELVVDGDAVFGAGIRIVFRESLVTRMKGGAGRPYLRFRINLTGDTKNTFSSLIPSRDRFFVSSAGVLEVTEFRLNERRSFPSSISNRTGRGEFNISGIHYFLIRDLEHQLISQHATFEKVRRLEAELWLKYIASAYPMEAERLTTELAERLVIYHWKEKDPKLKSSNKKASEDEPDSPQGMKDFIAFASFRTTSSNLKFYAFMIVLLGAAGSLLAAILTTMRANWIMPVGATGQPGASTVLAAEISLFGGLALLILACVLWPTISRWTRSAASAVWKERHRMKFRKPLRRVAGKE